MLIPMMRKHVLASILSLALTAAAAEAQTVRQVPLNFPTIQAAITAAQAGDTVRVAPGTYVENINFLGKAITVVSVAGPEVTIIDGNASGSVVSFTTNEGLSSVLEGFTIQNAKVSSGDGGGIRISASPTVRRNRIVNNVGCNGAGVSVVSGSPLIQGNVIRDNTANASGCGSTGGGGILVRGSGSAQILDNTISNNQSVQGGGGIGFFTAGTPLVRGNIITANSARTNGGGISMENLSDAKIIQNVIAGNTAMRGAGIYWLVPGGGQHGPSITSNSIVDNDASQQGSGIYADGFDGFTIVRDNVIIGKTGQPAIYCGNSNDLNPPVLEFNNVFAAQASAYSGFCNDVTGANGNISAAPLFKEAAAGNYRLLAGSPGIDDADKTVANLPTLDLDSIPRVLPSGGSLDLGAYEFAAATTSTVSPSTLTFADQNAGTVSAPLDVTLTNTGAEILVVSSIALPVDFSQTNTCQTASGIPAGQSCTISIRFAPNSGGPRSGQMAVSGNWGADSIVTLSANGLGAISLSTITLTFGDQRVGSLSGATAFTVSNTGSSALSISSITTTGDFTSTTDCPGSVPASSTCTVNVRFGPLARGLRYGAVTITDNATGSPHVVLLSGTGIAPTITFTPSSLSFSSLPIGGTSSPQTVTVSNQGDLALSISSISSSAEYSETHDCGASLPVNQTCTINVVFSPVAFGTRTGTITVADDAIGSPHTIALTGTGTGSFLSANPTSLSFGNQAIGVTSASRSITLFNTGNTVLAPTITASSDYSRTTNCSFLNSFASCTVFVTFKPTSLGSRPGTLTITSTAVGSPLIVPLTGTGVDVAFLPSAVNFGAVRFGTTKTLTTTFTNSSPNPVNIQDISVTANFSQQNNCGVALAPGASCSIAVTFGPPSTGSFSGTLSITDDALGSPHTVALAGTGGIGNVLISGSSSLQFGSSAIGTPSLPQSVTLSNNGSAPLTISAITTSVDFTQTNNCVSPITTGTSCTINVTFVPVAAGTRAASLTIVNDGSGNPNSVQLTGTGVAELPVPVITGISPDSRFAGGSGITITVTGSGFFPQSVVRWGGFDRATTFVNNTSLTVAIPATDFTTMKTFPVTVFNPAPGGGTSNRIGFAVLLPITLTVKDLVYDRISDRIYASVPATAPTLANTLTSIEPRTGALGNPVSIGSGPAKLAISDDSRSIYVGFDGAPQVRRFDTVTQTAGIAFALGSDTFNGPYYAEDIAVAPGNADTIAVSRKVLGISPKHSGVAIYDNGTKRPTETASHTGSNVIEFSASAATLYGYNNESSEYGFRTMSVGPAGVTVTNVVTSFDANLIAGFGTDIQFSGGRIYTTNGRVIDPVTRTVVGSFTFPIGFTDFRGVVVDSTLKRAFFLAGTPSSARILAFDTDTFAQTSSLTLPSLGLSPNLGSLIRWGRNGLAFRTTNQVITLEMPENFLDVGPSRDFNGDGKSDILWRDSSGNVSMWLMNGYSVVSNTSVASIWTGWTIAGSGDFNADGKADILWRDPDGNVVVWLMNGQTISSYAVVGNMPLSSKVAGVADFNGDGKADILWRSTSGDNSIWLMDGTTLFSNNFLGNIWTGWAVAGTGDFNGDGKADVLWRSVDGDVAVWLMNGVTVTSGVVIGNIWTGWTVVGVGDFNADGKADILWHSISGDVAMWLMDGTTVASSAVIGNIWTGWAIIGTGDLNGDSRADILWADAGGNVVAWSMDGTRLLSYAELGNVGDRVAQ